MVGQLFAGISYDKGRGPPVEAIRKALGRCMKRKGGKTVQQQLVAMQNVATGAAQEPSFQATGWANQKGFGQGGYGKGFYQASHVKGQKGKGKWQAGEASWGTKGKGQGNQPMMNLAQFSREIECCPVGDP